jgi:hypothetical protein
LLHNPDQSCGHKFYKEKAKISVRLDVTDAKAADEAAQRAGSSVRPQAGIKVIKQPKGWRISTSF